MKWFLKGFIFSLILFLIFVFIFNVQKAQASWAFVAHRGSANNKTGGANISVSPTASIPSGAFLVIRAASDNLSAVNGDNNEHTSVTDSKGNTYAQFVEFTNASGAAGSGVTVSMWGSILTVGLGVADSVTVNFSGAVNSKVMALEEFSIGAGSTFSIAGTGTGSGSTNSPSALVSGLVSQEYLFLGQVGVEGPNGDAFTQDADYANNTSVGTTGGGAATNISSRWGSRITTLTGDTYNPTLGNARDWAAIIVAIKEIAPVITVGAIGSQTSAMTIGATNNYVGGAFTLIRNIGSTTVTSITISETGTVNANTNLANVKLFFETAVTNCSAESFSGAETQYGATSSFNSSAKASFTGSMTVATASVCVYVVLDVGSGASSGETIEIEITNPATEVIASAGSVTPATAVAISGTTTIQAAVLPPPPPPSAGGEASHVEPTNVIFQGQAYPQSKINVLVKGSTDEKFHNVAKIEELNILPNGTFNIKVASLIRDIYLFTLEAEDQNNQKSGIIAFSVDLIASDKITIRDIFFQPTIAFQKSIVADTDEINIFGYAAPSNIVELIINGVKIKEIQSDETGRYNFTKNASDVKIGTHAASVRQIDKTDRKSNFSFAKTFKISPLIIVKSDLNKDNIVNITDWSIFLFRWGSFEENIKSTIDLNNDGQINIIDFSLFLKAIKI
ncbi:MAG: hypothetical protein HYV52_00470 [Parcubacteria group bacterium]|nr:hypothetical protein [Parcubacteria group bacterium]